MAGVQRRPSAQTLAVLDALAEARRQWRYGLELAAATGLKSGSLYPILARLDERGLVESKWLEPEKPGRPARHAYRITAAGRAALSDSQRQPHRAAQLAPEGGH
ncbi:MAG: helix-turn-helix transcriptional regulator [Proteobacteria bacterium]|nr:helix-turn-helix transcriptional regulator [Pseudomonadota bacterium]